MGEELRKRTVRLTGLGTTLDDTIGNLNEVASVARLSEEKAELDQMVRDLQKIRDGIKRFCRTWSREFDTYE